MLDEAEGDGDGEISKKEFKRIMKKANLISFSSSSDSD